ncbi:SMC-Scp complex subunit ScpB, partial [Streptococcus anginosus]|uniref:SMC-Scp complex subunit ScpB n=3 Tax=Lactobacillales TaxID=186826 RepID=UPI0021F826E0
KEKVQYSLWNLDKKLKTDSQRGLELVCLGGRYQLLTQKIYADLIQKYAVSPFALKLSQQALETLAVIAYQGPITRLEIDEIRGVQSQAMIKRLLLHDLIEEVGRKEGPGR